MRVHHEKKSDRMTVDDEKKSNAVKKSDGVRVHHKK